MSNEPSQYELLRKHHEFLPDRNGTVNAESSGSRLAKVYDSKLFKDVALIDLKHYKSKQLALRFRTASEVVDGIGEETCGSLRCNHHRPRDREPRLTLFELPFAYVEHGKKKEALVNVRLCSKCAAKLTWKPRGERDNHSRSPPRRRESRSKRT